MANISPEIVSKFSNMQPQVWQNVALAMSEASGQEVVIADALAIATDLQDLYSEMSAPKLVIQFAFANFPEHPQIILVDQETVRDMYESFTGISKESVDDAILTELRPAIESIVQGMCLAAGNIKSEAVVASGLVIRFQIFGFPSNMQNADQLIRTNVRISSQDLNGSMTWLVDETTAAMLTGVETESAEATPAPKPDDFSFEDTEATPKQRSAPTIIGLEDTGLEVLMDIPLEVTVELGRVKMAVRDVVELGSGSIVEIDKAAGEPVDVMVNGRLVARGEVVVIEDNFGVRITEILSQQDRLAKLSEVA